MGKQTTIEDGVGQLVLQIVFETNDRTEETEENGSFASTRSSSIEILPERKRKLYSLMDKVYALPNLMLAWHHVASNKGKPGIDRMTIEKFTEGALERLGLLSEDLHKKTYRPLPVRRVYIPKSGGGNRPLGIPSVRDRIVQQALLQILEPHFEARFSKYSHGFRKGRGCHTALGIVDRAVRHGKYQWVVDADIQTFFDSVDHSLMLNFLNEVVSDGSVLNLIELILKAGVVEPDTVHSEPTELGTPQGGPLSPLLANIYLHHFDVEIGKAGYGLVRYADDFVIFAKSENEAVCALELSRSLLEGALRLKLHPEKTRIVSIDAGFEFLGFRYFRDSQTGVLQKEVRRKSVLRFRETIRKHTPKLKTQRRVKPRNVTYARLKDNKQVEEMIRGLNAFLEGWHWYFKTVWSKYPQTPFKHLDSYVRGRIRLAITGRVGAGWWNVVIKNDDLRRLGLTTLDTWQSKYLMDQLVCPARKS